AGPRARLASGGGGRDGGARAPGGSPPAPPPSSRPRAGRATHPPPPPLRGGRFFHQRRKGRHERPPRPLAALSPSLRSLGSQAEAPAETTPLTAAPHPARFAPWPTALRGRPWG